MKTTYETNSWTKLAQEDSFEHGCFGPHTCDYGQDRFSADTVDGLVVRLTAFFGVPAEHTDLDACEEDGRIDFQRMENRDGEEPTKAEIERWKQGKDRMWAVTYTVYVERVTRETVALCPHATPTTTTPASP